MKVEKDKHKTDSYLQTKFLEICQRIPVDSNVDSYNYNEIYIRK